MFNTKNKNKKDKKWKKLLFTDLNRTVDENVKMRSDIAINSIDLNLKNLTLAKIIEELYELAMVLRKDGLLMLEQKIPMIISHHIKYYIELIIRGANSNYIRQVSDIEIFYIEKYFSLERNYHEIETLITKMRCIQEGCISIASQENPVMMRKKLCKFFMTTKQENFIYFS